MINKKQFLNIIEYFDKEDLTLGIGFTDNEIEAVIVFYGDKGEQIACSIQPVFQKVVVFRSKIVNIHLDSLLYLIKGWEHEYCTNHSDVDEYSFFDYMDEQLDKIVREKKIICKEQ
jgi:hypothetical protein